MTLLVQLSPEGKWHAVHRATVLKTACELSIPTASSYRDVDLVDSGARCRQTACIAERNRLAGRK